VYDVVWYSSDRRADAEKVLRRLDLQEAIDRQIGDLCMSQDGVDIPGQKCVGRCVCRNFLGAGALSLGDPRIADLCALTDHGTGLVGGYFTAEYLLSDQLKADADAQAMLEIRAYQQPPLKSHHFLKLAWSSFVSWVACSCAVLFTLPRYLKRQKARQLRSLAELEPAAGQLISEVTRGI
jgi:hypothetical protein